MPPSSVCLIADKLVSNDRQREYGHPFEDFGKTAAMMTGAGFSWKGQPIGPEHIPILMSLVKISRMLNNKNAYHKDSVVDICGYMKTAQLVQEKYAEEEYKHTLFAKENPTECLKSQNE